MKAPRERGRALVEALVANLAGPESPIGDPAPLTKEGLAAGEIAAGVALSPAMFALLAFDGGWVKRELGWFEGDTLAARPAAEVIAGWAGELWPAYEEVVGARFPGRVLPIGRTAERLSFVYLGDPDEVGEYPVLELDQDDTPVIAVEAAGFDVWLGRRLGLLGARAFASEAKATAKRLWNRQGPLDLSDVPKRLPAPLSGPAPGSVQHAPVALQAPKKARKLTDAQVAKALLESAEAGNVRRLGELIADAAARGMEARGLEDALCAAAHHDQPEAVAALLSAGVSANAKDRYGVALARAMWTRDDTVQDLLLARGANPNGPSVNGKTVLHEAVARGRESLVAKLLAAGADVNRRDSNGHTPLHAAVASSPPDPVPPIGILDRLLAAGAQVTTKVPLLPYALENAPDEHVARLIAAGADPNAPSAYLGRTALHVAFELRRDGLVPALVTAGADRKRADERGIRLDEVFGTAGEDVAPLEVRWAPAGRQRLTVRLRLAVVNPQQAATHPWKAFRADTWERAGTAGLVGGAQVSGTSVDFAGVAGICERTLVLDLEGASNDFVRWILCALLLEGHSPAAAGGLALGAPARVIGLWAEGSAEGVSLIAPADVRATLAAPWGLFRGFGGAPLPFPVSVGETPGIELMPVAPPTPEQVSVLERALRTWNETRPYWHARRLGGWPLDWGPASVVEGRVALRLLDLDGNRKAPSPWPYEEGPREALLEVLRTLHREVPLAGAEITFPSR